MNVQTIFSFAALACLAIFAATQDPTFFLFTVLFAIIATIITVAVYIHDLVWGKQEPKKKN